MLRSLFFGGSSRRKSESRRHRRWCARGDIFISFREVIDDFLERNVNYFWDAHCRQTLVANNRHDGQVVLRLDLVLVVEAAGKVGQILVPTLLLGAVLCRMAGASVNLDEQTLVAALYEQLDGLRQRAMFGVVLTKVLPLKELRLAVRRR